MDPQGANEKPRGSRMTVSATLRLALPYIAVGGALGAIVGVALGSAANGFRVGVVLGGVVAFTIMQRRRHGAS